MGQFSRFSGHDGLVIKPGAMWGPTKSVGGRGDDWFRWQCARCALYEVKTSPVVSVMFGLGVNLVGFFKSFEWQVKIAYYWDFSWEYGTFKYSWKMWQNVCDVAQDTCYRVYGEVLFIRQFQVPVIQTKSQFHAARGGKLIQLWVLSISLLNWRKQRRVFKIQILKILFDILTFLFIVRIY